MSESQSSSSSEHSTEKDKKKKHKVIPVMEPSLKVKLKTKQIVINLSMTHYDVIADVAQELQWRVQYNSKKGDWDVMWVDHMIEPQTLIKMHFFQKISHFPGIYVLARKNLLGMSFTQMAKKFPSQYNFFPKTWLLPSQFSEFRQQIEKNEQNNENQSYIVKPEADCQGRGIFLTFKTDEVENGKHYVVQRYLHNPFLIDGLKFDFRVYVLLCGTNPMRLYIYQEGLARLATQKYEQPTKSNLKKMCMHLTNYAINKKNPKYVFNTSIHNMHTGHKRTLTSVFKNIQKRGLNVQSLKKKIDDVLVKTVIMGQPLVSHQYKFCQPDDENRNMCFHILGVDVMLDQFLDPYVLEVNHTPSFATDTPLDYFIKFNLIKDTLTLMNINEDSKKQLLKKTNSYQRERVTNAKRLIQNEQQRQRVRQAQAQRDRFQGQNLGRYRKIYPVENEEQMQQYSQFLKYADKIYFSQNNVIRSQIQLQKQKSEKVDKIQKDRQKEKVDLDIKTEKSLTNSKKNIVKRSIHENNSYSLTKQTHNQPKYRAASQKQIEQNSLKNSSIQFLHRDATRDIRISSLLNNNHLSSFSSNYSSRLSNIPSTIPTALIKITKSISQLDYQQQPQINRISLVKNLPKIGQLNGSGKKGSGGSAGEQKSKYMSLRRKKVSEIKEDKIKESLNRIEFKNYMQPLSSSGGAFLTPKVIKFHNEQDDYLISEKPDKIYFVGSSTGNIPGI